MSQYTHKPLEVVIEGDSSRSLGTDTESNNGSFRSSTGYSKVSSTRSTSPRKKLFKEKSDLFFSRNSMKQTIKKRESYDGANFYSKALSNWPYKLFIIAICNCFAIVVCCIRAGVAIGDPVRWEEPSAYGLVPGYVETHRRVADHNIPTMERFYLNHEDEVGDHYHSTPYDDFLSNTTCIDRWLEVYKTVLPGLQTDPAVVEDLLYTYYLEDHPAVRDVLHDLLSAPVNVSDFLADVASCAKGNAHLVGMACTTIDNPALHINYDNHPTFHNSTMAALTHAMVMDAIMTEASTNAPFLADMFDYITQKTWHIKLKHLDDIGAETFMKDKMNMIYQSARVLAIGLGEEGAHHYPRQILSLWNNILAAAKVDVDEGFHDNAMVGLLLNGNTNYLDTYSDRHLVWPVTKDWADLYIAWNLGYVLRFGNQNLYWKLLFPKILCQDKDASQFVETRILSLLMNLVVTAGPRYTASTEEIYKYTNPDLRRAWGETLFPHTHMHPATRTRMKKIFTSLCGDNCLEEWKLTDSGPLDDETTTTEEFSMFATYVLSFTTIFAGLALEGLIGVTWLSLSEEFASLGWKITQALFSLCLAIGLYSQSVFGLPFLVFGLWKGGFPETLCYFERSQRDWTNKIYRDAISGYCNGLGLLLHHSICCIVVCNLITGRFPLNRELQVATILLVIQHWFVILRYISFTSYVVSLLGVEAVWQWQVISNLQHYTASTYDYTARGLAMSMLVAHWLFLIAYFIESLPVTVEDSGEESSFNPLKTLKKHEDNMKFIKRGISQRKFGNAQTDKH